MVAYKHDINDIIIKALAWLPGGWEYGEHLSIATATFTMLFGLIKRTYPTTSKTTLQRHLDKMVKHNILAKKKPLLLRSEDAGTSKRTFYNLSRNTYINIRDSQRYWNNMYYYSIPRVKSNREPHSKLRLR